MRKDLSELWWTPVMRRLNICIYEAHWNTLKAFKRPWQIETLRNNLRRRKYPILIWPKFWLKHAFPPSHQILNFLPLSHSLASFGRNLLDLETIPHWRERGNCHGQKDSALVLILAYIFFHSKMVDWWTTLNSFKKSSWKVSRFIYCLRYEAKFTYNFA